MLKKLDILGLELDNYTVREAMLKAETYLNNNEMNTIETISMAMLEKAGRDEKMRDCLKDLDLAVIGEKEILSAAGVNSMQRMKETMENTFFCEFMKRLLRNKKTVYLLGEKETDVKNLEVFLHNEYERLKIVGQYAMENCSGDLDAVVNAINVETPDLVFSVLPSPYQEQFLMDNKGKLSIGIWYGLGEHYATESHSVLRRLRQLISRKKLENSLSEYKNENEA